MFPRLTHGSRCSREEPDEAACGASTAFVSGRGVDAWKGIPHGNAIGFRVASTVTWLRRRSSVPTPRASSQGARIGRLGGRSPSGLQGARVFTCLTKQKTSIAMPASAPRVWPATATSIA
jgi:hypothetical protein